MLITNSGNFIYNHKEVKNMFISGDIVRYDDAQTGLVYYSCIIFEFEIVLYAN